MKHRRKLIESVERYEALLRMTADPQAIAALEQLIQETRNRLGQEDESRRTAFSESDLLGKEEDDA